MLKAAGPHPGFFSMKRVGVFLLPLDGELVHRRSLPGNLSGFLNNWQLFIFTPGWRETVRESSVFLKNTTARKGLEPGPLDLGTRAVIMGPPRLYLHEKFLSKDVERPIKSRFDRHTGALPPYTQ